MLRITPSHSAEGAARYYDAALGRSDYYGQQERGLWAGKGAEMFGLRGEVSREQFVALANNQRPGTRALVSLTNYQVWKRSKQKLSAKSSYRCTCPITASAVQQDVK